MLINDKSVVLFAVEQPNQFANPQYRRCSGDDNHPVGQLKGYDVEELAADFYNKNLTGKYGASYSNESSTPFHMQCRTSGGECACIKHVPELQEDKCGEEQTEFVRVQAFVVRYESGM